MVDSKMPTFTRPDLLFFHGASGTKLSTTPQIARFSLGIAAKDVGKAAGAFGVSIPKNIGEMIQAGQSFALCLGPDEYQLMVPMALANPLMKNFSHLRATTPHSLVDISYSQVGIEVCGPLATTIISAGCPLDLSVLPVGGCARSILDKLQVIVIKTGEQNYQLQIMRSFAPFAGKLLAKAAIQYEAELALNSGEE
ncbi:MAG: hypothetical protein L3J13_00635 [Devosiaceae bacterium]|nr:hypothetical protein [Devosiaceae bacterium]